MLRLRLLATLTVTSLTAACADRPSATAPDPGVREPAPRFGKSTTSNPRATFYVANNPPLAGDSPYLLRGDGITKYLEPDGLRQPAGTSRYKDAECGVSAWVWAQPGESGDAIVDGDMTVARKCLDYPRKVRMTFAAIDPASGATTPDGEQTVVISMNLLQLQKAANNGNPAIYIPIGQKQPRSLVISDSPTGAPGRCGLLYFNPTPKNGTTNGSNQVQVQRDAGDQWTVFTLPDEEGPDGKIIHHDKVLCENTGTMYHMPLRLTIVTTAPLSPQ